MTQNKKIQYGVAAAMLLSMFLPFLDIMGLFSFSIFDVITNSEISSQAPDLWLFVGLIVAFAALTFMNKPSIARIVSGILLAIILWKLYDITSDTPDDAPVSIFDFLGIGAYLLFASTIAGVIYSKED